MISTVAQTTVLVVINNLSARSPPTLRGVYRLLLSVNVSRSADDFGKALFFADGCGLLVSVVMRLNKIFVFFAVSSLFTLLFCFSRIPPTLAETKMAPPAGSQKTAGPGESEDKFLDQEKGEGVCGNSLCEPNKGETRESCPRDCSAQE